MELDKDQSWAVIDAHRRELADLLETLTPAEWSTRSWCTAWTVKDVAAHLSLAASATLGEVLTSAVRGRGNFDATIADATLVRSAARTPAEIIADLRSIIGSRRLAPGTFWRDPLLDILVHGQDLARPIGRSVTMPTRAAREATDWAWRRRFPFFPARRFRGVRLVADDINWSRGSGAELRGPIASLLLVSCGRMAALDDLSGSGRDVLSPARPAGP